MFSRPDEQRYRDVSPEEARQFWEMELWGNEELSTWMRVRAGVDDFHAAELMTFMERQA